MRAHSTTADAVACSPGQSCAEVARLLRDRAAECAVVLEGGRVVGVVTNAALVSACVAEGEDPRRLAARDVMRPVPVDHGPTRRTHPRRPRARASRSGQDARPSTFYPVGGGPDDVALYGP